MPHILVPINYFSLERKSKQKGGKMSRTRENRIKKNTGAVFKMLSVNMSELRI